MILHPHDPSWSKEFQRLKAEYERSLGLLLQRVEHVGSTAIRGLAAKPILDIDLVISAETDFPAVKEALEKIGYWHNGDQDIPEREVFKRLNESVPSSKSTRSWMEHHLYVCVEGSRELKRHTRFREYLNANAEARIEYESIKQEIEARSGGDRKIYAAIKENEGSCTAFVEKILEKVEQADPHCSG